MAVADKIEVLVTRSPGLTEAEIAAALFGDTGSQQRVNKACMDLVKSRRLERGGRGGRSNPFRYFPKESSVAPVPQPKRRQYLA
jgi:hypothetical protein